MPQSVAAEVQNQETLAEHQVKQCGEGPTFNSGKVVRILKSAASKILQLNMDYFTSHKGFQESWISQIENEVISSLLYQLPTSARHYMEPFREQIKAALELDRDAPVGSVEAIDFQLRTLFALTVPRMGTKEIAAILKITQRSVQRHFAGATEVREDHIRAYEKLLSERLGRPILLSRLSVADTSS